MRFMLNGLCSNSPTGNYTIHLTVITYSPLPFLLNLNLIVMGENHYYCILLFSVSLSELHTGGSQFSCGIMVAFSEVYVSSMEGLAHTWHVCELKVHAEERD